MAKFIYINCDHDISYLGARDRENNYLNDGVCVWVLLKPTPEGDEEISNGILDYVVGSNGDYRAVIDRSITVLLEEGLLYFVDILFQCNEFEDHVRMRRNAMYRC